MLIGCFYKTFFKDYNYNTMMIEQLDLELAERCMVSAEIHMYIARIVAIE